MPEMARELDADAALAGLTLQANWVAKGIGTLVIGAVADSHGRKKAILGIAPT